MSANPPLLARCSCSLRPSADSPFQSHQRCLLCLRERLRRLRCRSLRDAFLSSDSPLEAYTRRCACKHWQYQFQNQNQRCRTLLSRTERGPSISISAKQMEWLRLTRSERKVMKKAVPGRRHPFLWISKTSAAPWRCKFKRKNDFMINSTIVG